MSLLGIIIVKNKEYYDLTNTAISVDARELLKKEKNFVVIDEENRIIPHTIDKQSLLIFPYILPASSETIFRIVKYRKTIKKPSISLIKEKEKRKLLYLGKKIEILKKYPFSYGHIQGMVRLGNNFFITSVDIDKKIGYLLKTKLEEGKIKIVDKLSFSFGDIYHPSGICDDFNRRKVYLAVAQYKPKVTKATKILEVDTQTMKYKEILEIEDHIGSVCVDKLNIYLFSWDGEKMYIYTKDGEFKGAIFRREWGKVQDCDVLYDKIYATSQNEDKIYVIDTKKWKAVESIYTPKGLTNEGFDIDHKNPSIFWFSPDDGYIYKTRYKSIYGYNIKIKNIENIKLHLENKDKIFIYIDKTIALMRVLGKEFSVKHRSSEINIKISKNKVSVYTKDAKFRINVNENVEFDRYLLVLSKTQEDVEVYSFPPPFVETELRLF